MTQERQKTAAALAELYALIEPCRTVSLISLCKNAGKTTVLNHLLRAAARRGVCLGLTSIGRDGEDTDLVTGTGKPGVYIEAGTVVATAEGLLPYCDATREILDATGISTPLGQVVVFRALSAGSVQIGGPSVVAQLAAVAGAMRGFGAEKVFVDGALGRKSLASRRLSEASVLCAGASFSPVLEAVVGETAHFCELALLPLARDAALTALAQSELPQKAALIGETVIFPKDGQSGASVAAALRAHKANKSRRVFIEGALTDALLEPFAAAAPPLGGIALVVRDASRLLAGRAAVQKLRARGGRLEVLESVNLAAVAINPFSARGPAFEPGAFLSRMREALPVPVFDLGNC